MGFLSAPVSNCEIFYPLQLSFVVLVGVFYLIRKKYFVSRLSRLGIIFILLGGIGNTLERVFTGCVRDYVDFFGQFRFNFFDLLVTSGVFLLIYELWKNKK
ncbi:MAG: Lipoprotein signal peptidase [candidate division WWE3 bacterium GW2011_GWF2_41_45]|uniref:Uncharacterized protein n=2 Tax=Katanobacteria TaxID=422282 RepID=A0A1F4W250_UNCKA|nr:MAG: Lipoprotein signal peptidase [candidate division WWE3 bacterium GW2011_GWC2_41_23]KKS10504.1 MAG: Lipoprotein signal peptidase [candidate division WWE3 bacterium GW2011_GWF2_41_45]KKS20301.1 MAG: Lipoprotein signal peptidase [candidate division WWE3 bacterium GW2011_GWE1_41_72]KKS28460.1 MAG: Lipoprotein signal peptidase [candidate division WWE3 bacterium GW2011_GWD2_42_11]KKS51057.1 MAG: Lipoprotein signal peptidase [candidate division WWE3 bacterium GW2011_GWE2_42_25]KKS63890.1 MAG: 